MYFPNRKQNFVKPHLAITHNFQLNGWAAHTTLGQPNACRKLQHTLGLEGTRSFLIRPHSTAYSGASVIQGDMYWGVSTRNLLGWPPSSSYRRVSTVLHIQDCLRIVHPSLSPCGLRCSHCMWWGLVRKWHALNSPGVLLTWGWAMAGGWGGV